MLREESQYITAKYPSISNKELEYIQGSIGYTDEQTRAHRVGSHNISDLWYLSVQPNIQASVKELECIQ